MKVKDGLGSQVQMGLTSRGQNSDPYARRETGSKGPL